MRDASHFRQWAVVVAVVLSAQPSSAAAQAQCTAVGHDRWTVKTSPSMGSRPHAVSISDFASLGVPAAIAAGATGGKLMESRYPGVVSGGVHEGQLVRVTGWVRFIKTSTDDCDYHIQIEPTRDGHDGMIIVEIPAPGAMQVANASLRSQLAALRPVFLKALKLTREPSKGGNTIEGAYMTFEGAAFFDAPHYPSCGRRGSGDTAVTCWEIHPVTAVKFARRP